MTSKNTMKAIGILLELLALPIFIVNIVLLSMPNPDIRVTGILIIVSTNTFTAGLILSHRPKENKEEKKCPNPSRLIGSEF